MDDYPTDRASCKMFALHFIKWLSDSGAVQEIGPDGFALLVAIATKEDDTYYERPVNFFNEQLAARCGIVSVHSLIRARDRCIAAGLLSYEPAAKRKPGRYFVAGFHAQSAGNPEGITADSMRKAQGIRKESGRNPQASNPIPIPNLKPKEKAPSASSPLRKDPAKKQPKFDPLAIELPSALQTDRFRDAWQDWVAHRIEKKKPLTPTSVKLQLRELSNWGESRAVAAINFTIAKGWEGLREPETDSAPGRPTAPQPPKKKLTPIGDPENG